MKDITRVAILAIVLDTAYQLLVFRAFYLGQALIVVVVCAIVPYLLFRSLITRLTRRLYKKHGPIDIPAANTTVAT